MHEEQWVGRWLINMKRCGSSSWLHMKYSGSLGSKIHWNDCGLAAYLFQFITSMSEEIFLCIVHLLLALKTIHAGHKCWHCTGMLEAFGGPIHSHTLTPGPGLLARNSRWDPRLIKQHRTIIQILYQVHLSSNLLQPKVTQWRGDPSDLKAKCPVWIVLQLLNMKHCGLAGNYWTPMWIIMWVGRLAIIKLTCGSSGRRLMTPGICFTLWMIVQYNAYLMESYIYCLNIHQYIH